MKKSPLAEKALEKRKALAAPEGEAATFKWVCPSCGAKPTEHGKGDCRDRDSSHCNGFLCDCYDETADNHGATLKDACPCAHCWHCGWEGTFPKKPKGLAPWEKSALDAGWMPPEARIKELGMVVTKEKKG